MKNLIVANFKMNTTVKQFSNYLDEFIPKVKQSKNDIVLCIPYTHLMLAGQKLVSTNIKFGAQNLSTQKSGAMTGEISNVMIKDLGAEYVLVGHSERRQNFKETNEQINKKLINALSVNLKAILCVGETKTEKNTKKTRQVIQKQLELALSDIYENELNNIIIAYEPVWAIGSGKVPTVLEVKRAVNFIRQVICDNFSKEASEKIKILYGGSINEKNYENFLKIEEINGLLVGGASLDSSIFSQIVK